MSTFDPTEELARIAHELWRRCMLDEGWTHGPAYDEAKRTHDALVPYESLCDRDRDETRLAIRTLGLAEDLAAEVGYSRGPERPFTLEEMRVGLPVTWAEEIAVEEGGVPGPPDKGTIESWESNPETGELTCVRVRWEDGSLSEHAPSETDLRRTG